MLTKKEKILKVVGIILTFLLFGLLFFFIL